MVKAINLLLNNFYKNKESMKTILYPMPVMIVNGYNTRKIKVISAIYDLLNNNPIQRKY